MRSDSGFDEVEMCRFPEVLVADGVTVDGHATAMWQQADGRIRWVWDGIVGEPMDGLVETRDGVLFHWSDDGRHVAYIGIRAAQIRGTTTSRISRTRESRVGPPVFSADGEHLAYETMSEGTAQLIVDGRPVSGAPLAPIAAVFGGEHGERIAFVEMREEGGAERAARIVVDGEPGPWFAGMRNASGAMQFSEDGGRFAYYHIDGKGHGQWVVDGVPQRWIKMGTKSA